jgi:hypothetical protein
LDEPALEEREDDQDRQHQEDTEGEDLTPVGRLLALEGARPTG